MAVAGYNYQNRASGSLKNSGIFFIISCSVSLILTILSFWVMVGWFGLFREIIYIVALILLISALGALGLLIPHAKDDIDSSRRWLLAWLILDFAWVFGNLIHPIATIVLLVIAVIARIFGFVKLNHVFQSLSDAFPSQGTFDSWMYHLYGFYGIVLIIPTIIGSLLVLGRLSLPLFTLNILGIVIGAISFLLSLGVGILFIQNAQKLLGVSLTAVPGIPYAPQLHYKPVEQSGPIQSDEHAIKRFCDNCGAKRGIEEKFCQNCGQSLT